MCCTEMMGLRERLSKRLMARRQQRFLDGLKIACYAPYPSHVYRSLLVHALSSPRIQLPPFARSNRPSVSSASLFVRHDIDTKKCIQNMALLLDIDRELSVPAGVFFRAEGEEYSLASYRGKIQAYRAAGLEIGLHTLCYLEDDYLGAFRRETEVFRHAVGFTPASFTVHGLGHLRMDIRLRFCEEICTRLEEFGYAFSDCCNHLRTYDYTIHDSHWNQEAEARFIYNDFFDFPPLVGGRNYILLTHPGYWVGSD